MNILLPASGFGVTRHFNTEKLQPLNRLNIHYITIVDITPLFGFDM
jgi:hypothetical protein